MTARDDSPSADALRDAGYVKLPPLWVPAEMRDDVVNKASKHLNDIQRIKREARR
jgi:hypothetical protein